jgi:hypothetical protein
MRHGYVPEKDTESVYIREQDMSHRRYGNHPRGSTWTLAGKRAPCRVMGCTRLPQLIVDRWDASVNLDILVIMA